MVLYRACLEFISILPDNDHTPYFNTLEDIQKKYDNLALLVKEHKKHVFNMEFTNKTSGFAMHEYENDDFCVIAPKLPEDVYYEASMLRLEMRPSLLRLITEENMEILFIRKKDDATMPFFTAIIKDNVILDALGFKFKAPRSAPGLIDFIEEWAEKRNLEIQ